MKKQNEEQEDINERSIGVSEFIKRPPEIYDLSHYTFGENNAETSPVNTSSGSNSEPDYEMLYNNNEEAYCYENIDANNLVDFNDYFAMQAGLFIKARFDNSTSEKNESDNFFQDTFDDHEQNVHKENVGWKLHISICKEDIKKAWDSLLPIFIENKIKMVKVRNSKKILDLELEDVESRLVGLKNELEKENLDGTFREELEENIVSAIEKRKQLFLEKENANGRNDNKQEQIGKEITIYALFEPIEKDWQKILTDIENKLLENDVDFSERPEYNNEIKGSRYLSYRNDDNGEGKYKPAILETEIQEDTESPFVAIEITPQTVSRLGL